MKWKKITALVLCALLAGAICGCTKTNQPAGNSTAAETAQEKTDDIISSAQEEAVPDEYEETKVENPDSGEEIDLPEDALSMMTVLGALCDTPGSYNPSDPAYFWSAVSNLLANDAAYTIAGEMNEDGTVAVPAESMPDFEAALFGTIDPDEEIPELTTDLSETCGIFYDEENDRYVVEMRGEDDSYQVEALGYEALSGSEGRVRYRTTIDGREKEGTAVIVPTKLKKGKLNYWYSVTDFE